MGHIQDRWYRDQPDGDDPTKKQREKTSLYGVGLRYKARWIDREGRERSKMFPDRQLRQAREFLAEMENQIRTGDYLDPDAGKILFRTYAAEWFAGQNFDGSTRNAVERRLRKLVYPYLGDRPLGSILPTHIRGWLGWMQGKKLAGGTKAVVFVHVSAIFNAAIDDKKIRENPCKVKSVSAPQPDKKRIVPWSAAKLAAIRLALPKRYKIVVALGAGCGLRQGEIFGLSDVDIDRDGGVLHVVRQVRWVDGVPVFAPPKGGKTRDVPLPASVLRELDTYMEGFPPREITLPWREADGEPEAVRLVLVNALGAVVGRQSFNQLTWDGAFRRAKLRKAPRQDGMHALRHFYASVLLDAGESIKALAEWLGHADPAFTMRVYTHLMPTSADRTRRAIDQVFRGEAGDRPEETTMEDGPGASDESDGLETA
jgi:integrase